MGFLNYCIVKLLKIIVNKVGIDGAVAYTVLSRAIQAGGGIITILFVAKFLTKVEQGYYYTFGSILAMQVFFELGLSGIITQFVAYESANLKWLNSKEIEGDVEVLSRLSSLLHFCIKWFIVVAITLFVILILVGYFFFNKFGVGNEDVEWIIPWIILSISTATSLLISPILAFLEGLGMVKDVAKIRLVQQCCQIFVLFVCFLTGFKLFSSPVASCVALFVAPAFILFSSKKTLLLFIWKQLKQFKVNYRTEIFPYQWRIALSWISGYFMYQLFNPIVFAIDGPVVAGQIGVTLVVLNGILSLPLSWINTKVPLFSSLIAKKDYFTLDRIFGKTLKQASMVCFICLLSFVLGVFMMKNLKLSIGNRFLPLIPTILLSVTTFVNQFVSALATYLRCHKQEPFLVYSIVMAILTATSTLIFGTLYGVYGITLGYSILTITLSLLWASLIFKKKKELWHL